MKTFLIIALSMVSGSAAAQTEADPVSSARMRLGPLALTPAIAIQNIGIDSNVFNEVENPKQDFTATLRPQLETWLRLGRARLNVDASVEATYFKRYTSQRSVSPSGSATLEFRWNRLTALAGGGVLSTRERPSVEIDTRARRVENTLTVGSNARLTGKTSLGVLAERRKIDFAAGVEVSGSSLSTELNRDEVRFTTFLEHSLTTLTTIVLRADVQRDTFDFSPDRDAKVVRVAPSVQFKPNALVAGSARVGYLQFDPLQSSAPPFHGTFASVDLSYTFRRMTRFAVQSQRDVQYSFDPSQSYYLSTEIGGSVSQAFGRSWSVTARLGRQRLNYRGMASDAISGPTQVDKLNVYGATIAYRLSPSIQFGLNADYQRRRAGEHLHGYEGLRAGSFVNYGLGGG